MSGNKAEQFTKRTDKPERGEFTKKVNQERATKNDYRDNREKGRINHKMEGASSVKKDYGGNKTEQFAKKVQQERAIPKGKDGPSRGR